MENLMKHYKDPATSDIYAYAADGSDDAYIKEGLVPISDEELAELRKPKPLTGEQLHEQWKVKRAAAVAAIVVETKAGNTFDGDEVSQGRMARAIIGLNASGDPATTITWVLADNTPVLVTAAELTEAVVLSGNAQSELWIPTHVIVEDPIVEEPVV